MKSPKGNAHRKATAPKSGEAQRSAAPESATFPVVGIGASAGGLEAFTELLRYLPEQTGMAFVLVQHLDPTHGSVLQEILARTTKIPVSEVTDGVVIRRDHVYVIPANANMVIEDGCLRLVPRDAVRGRNMPIDHFFCSLAERRGEQAIAVVLSGTASDGTLGCGAVKTAGGITFAQDEKSAKYGGMPRSAVYSGCIDFVLPPKSIAQELVRIGRHPYVARATADSESASAAGSETVHALLVMLREATGVDFTEYKPTTLQRRIKRRIVLHRLEKLEDYLAYIKSNPGELEELYRDVLINVTGFFRDPEAFEALASTVLPAILQARRAEDGPLRFWVPGCSTGEEAYSIAIVLTEYLWDHAPKSSASANAVQIFATDISDSALDRARIGVYSEAAVSDVSPERLKRFFLPQSNGFQISKAVREMCIFAKQNVAKDPPFSNLDLVSCRNLLIYLGPVLQRRVIPALHYALRPNGYLILGGSETLGLFADQFIVVDKKSRIYRKKPTSARLATFFTPQPHEYRKVGGVQVSKPAQSGLSIEKEVDRLLVNRFVPASVVVNDALEIVQFRGKTGAYLEPAAGQPTFSLSKMAREGLLIDLREALIHAKKDHQPVRKQGVRIKSDAGTREIDLEVIPVRGETSSENYYVIVFQESLTDGAARPKRGAKKRPEKRNPANSERERSDREIAHLREQLQALIEDHETTLEEYKSSNEELLSANEELQSTNEEMETAKEELQSTNEELTTLNEELQNRNAELSMSNNDMVNLLSNVSLPIVMVGDDLRIRRFTPLAEKLLNFCAADIGRRLAEIRPNLVGVDLDSIVRDTIESGTSHEQEVQGQHDRYLMRVRPYKTWNNKIEGAVITFLDIDAIRLTLEESRRQ